MSEEKSGTFVMCPDAKPGTERYNGIHSDIYFRSEKNWEQQQNSTESRDAVALKWQEF